MRIPSLTSFIAKLKIKIPESYIKEEIVRFLTETRSERVVELPFVFENLPKRKIKILDIGCRYSILPIELASLGNDVYGIDILPYRRRHPNFTFKQGDILNTKLLSNFFDMAISLSTIEHIGLGFYGEGLDSKGDIEAVEKIYRFLKKGGIFLITAPFGKPTDTSWYRVYNLSRLKILLQRFKIQELDIYREKSGYWKPCSLETGEKIDSSNKVSSVFVAKAVKK